MNAKEAIEQSFRRMVGQKEYERITVSDICRDAQVSRKSFYVNFRNKDALLQDIFKREAIDPIGRLNELVGYERGRQMSRLFVESMYEGIIADREFYESILDSFGKDGMAFLRIISEAIYDFNVKVFSDTNVKESNLPMEYIARFYAASHAILIQKWIRDGFTVPIPDLANLYVDMASEYLNSLL